jgi:hypothetical protein
MIHDLYFPEPLGPAIAMLMAGDTLRLHCRGRDGRYRRSAVWEEAILDPPLPDAASWDISTKIIAAGDGPIWLRPPPGYHGVRITRGSFIEFIGINIDAMNCTSAGLKITRGGDWPVPHHIRWADSEIRNSKGQGIHVSQPGVDFNEFLYLNVHHNGTNRSLDHGAYIQTNYNLLMGGQYWSNRGAGVHIYNGVFSDQPGAPVANVLRDLAAFGNFWAPYDVIDWGHMTEKINVKTGVVPWRPRR